MLIIFYLYNFYFQRDYNFTITLIKELINSDFNKLLTDGTVYFICNNIDIKINEDDKKEVENIIILMIEKNRYPDAIYGFITAFKCIINNNIDIPNNYMEDYFKKYIFSIINEQYDNIYFLKLIFYLISYYNNILNEIESNISYKLIKKFIFYDFDLTNILDCLLYRKFELENIEFMNQVKIIIIYLISIIYNIRI